MARRKPRFRVVSQALVHGQVIAAFRAEYPTFGVAARKAARDAKTRGYHTSVEDVTQGPYSHREGYLAICTPQRKRGRSYAQCKFSSRGRQLLAVR